MPATSINPNGRIVTTVKIKAPSILAHLEAVEVQKELMCDTGSPITMVDWDNLARFFGRTPAAAGPLFGGNMAGGAMAVLKVLNVTMEVEVEDHGGGNAQTRTCSEMYAHFLKPFSPTETFKGLLGMDQFDRLKADPVKNAAGTAARLAKRV